MNLYVDIQSSFLFFFPPHITALCLFLHHSGLFRWFLCLWRVHWVTFHASYLGGFDSISSNICVSGNKSTLSPPGPLFHPTSISNCSWSHVKSLMVFFFQDLSLIYSCMWNYFLNLLSSVRFNRNLVRSSYYHCHKLMANYFDNWSNFWSSFLKVWTFIILFLAFHWRNK